MPYLILLSYLFYLLAYFLNIQYFPQSIWWEHYLFLCFFIVIHNALTYRNVATLAFERESGVCSATSIFQIPPSPVFLQGMIGLKEGTALHMQQ